jgi:hypothetical protein
VQFVGGGADFRGRAVAVYPHTQRQSD